MGFEKTRMIKIPTDWYAVRAMEILDEDIRSGDFPEDGTVEQKINYLSSLDWWLRLRYPTPPNKEPRCSRELNTSTESAHIEHITVNS